MEDLSHVNLVYEVSELATVQVHWICKYGRILNRKEVGDINYFVYCEMVGVQCFFEY